MNNYIKDIQRLQELLSYGIMDTPEEEYLNDLAELTSLICNTPISLITFIDDKRQWYKAKVGTEAMEVPIEETICQYALGKEDILEFEDTLQAEILNNHPHVYTENGVRFYAGINLYSTKGHAIGTLCIVDIKPKKLVEFQREALRLIAKQVMIHLDLCKKNEDLNENLKSLLDEKIEEAKQQTRFQEIAYNNLYNAIEKSNAIIEFDPKGVIMNVNDNFLEIYGYTREELVGRKDDILLDEEDANKNSLFWEALESGKSQSGRYKRIHKNGNVIWIQASYSPVLGADGKIAKITKIAQDVTAEVESRNTLENAKKMADELNVQKDVFIANMSHELRTPINAIVGFSDLLHKNEKDPSKLKYISAVRSASESLLFLVNDILDLSKIESGLFKFDEAPFNLKHVIEDVFNTLSLRAETKELEFKFFMSHNVPTYLEGDKNRLIQVLNNLLNNGIKFTHQGKVHLLVDLVTDNASVAELKFSVVDTGIGIPKDKLEEIFNRFTQAEFSTSRVYGGTGLGLNISKLLVEKQNGKIGVSSEAGRGSEFWFQIPFNKVSENIAEEEFHSSTSNKIIKANILLCEDNELNRMLVESIFADLDFDLTLAENGLEAVEVLKNQKIDLILMDLQMPHMDGYQATKYIREELKMDIPIIALTAHSLVKEKEKCFAMGMNGYLSKPFKLEELLAKIQSELEGHLSKNASFSIERLNEFLGNNKEIVEQLLQVFVTQSTKDIGTLQEAFAMGDLTTSATIVHKMKSSLGVIQVDNELVSKLEEQLLSQEKEEELKKTLEKFVAQIETINKDISQKNYE